MSNDRKNKWRERVMSNDCKTIKLWALGVLCLEVTRLVLP